MAKLTPRYNKWQATVRIPKARVGDHNGATHLYRTLEATDRENAKVEASVWEAGLRAAWAEAGGKPVSKEVLRGIYAQTRSEAETGSHSLTIAPQRDIYGTALTDGWDEGISLAIERIAEAVGDAPHAEPTPIQQAKLDALNDAMTTRRGGSAKIRPDMELSFSELTQAYMAWWRSQKGLKVSNTEQQKHATFHMFKGFWQDRPIRAIKRGDANKFVDALRRTDPLWARSKSGRELEWGALQSEFGNHPIGLSDSTVNRHVSTLQALWEWGADRDHAEGRNPFSGLHKRLKLGVNVETYLPWSMDELHHLLQPAPKRKDLHEIITVALFTGMRVNEIASLEWGDIHHDEGIALFHVRDAKTIAGNRYVPVHSALRWIIDRSASFPPSERIWPTFNLEGPAKKAGADAGREFSRFKNSRGFNDRQKTFHSFRKNVTRQMERAGVPENEWAEVVGHAKGFTYAVYNPDGISVQRKADIIGLISYPEIEHLLIVSNDT